LASAQCGTHQANDHLASHKFNLRAHFFTALMVLSHIKHKAIASGSLVIDPTSWK
jgi:hypothetical protein